MTHDPDYVSRRRPFAPVHRRSIELQQLDALHRIEELLAQNAIPYSSDVNVEAINAVVPDAATAPKRGRRK